MRIESPQTCKVQRQSERDQQCCNVSSPCVLCRIQIIGVAIVDRGTRQNTSHIQTSNIQHAVISNLVAACMNEDKIRPSFLFYGEDFAEKHHQSSESKVLRQYVTAKNKKKLKLPPVGLAKISQRCRRGLYVLMIFFFSFLFFKFFFFLTCRNSSYCIVQNREDKSSRRSRKKEDEFLHQQQQQQWQFRSIDNIKDCRRNQ